MPRRLLESLGVATAIATVAVLLQLAAVPVEGQAPSETPWGHPNLEGIWLDVYATPLERPAALGDREFFTAAERAERDQARMVNPGRNARGQDGRTDVAGAYKRRLHVGAAGGPAHVARRRPAERENSRPHAGGPTAQRGGARVAPHAPAHSTETCRVGGSGCAGGEYGPASPRRFDVVPFYNTGRMNRHFGPEDQSLGDRCMSGRTPDLNGFRRIVQGEDSVAIAYDTGQGQGYQRVVNLSGDHPPSNIRLRHGDSRGRWGGPDVGHRDHELLTKVPLPRVGREPPSRGTLYPYRRGHARVRGDDRGPDGVGGAVDRSGRS